MHDASWPPERRDVASARQHAAAFLDNLTLNENFRSVGRQSWISKWTKLGDEQGILGDLKIKKGALDEAAEAWLCALTAFEVAKRLGDEDDQQTEAIIAKIETGVQRLATSLKRKVESVQIGSYDDSEFLAYYLPAFSRDLFAPAVICISREEESAATLLGRVFPAVIGRSIAVLVVAHEDVSSHWGGQSEALLSSCLDYLLVRPEIDSAHVGVYGQGLSAVLATDFAVSDRRVAAAVCDGGLWNWTRVLASVTWMTRTADEAGADIVSGRRLRMVEHLRCPALVVAGGPGNVCVSEAIKLQADCTAAGIDLEVALPRITRGSMGEIENFVTSDDSIFAWLEHKLIQRSAP
ncbi:alpha/beta hydrolase family protein [Bradyrhizobium sp. USDA 3650]